MFHDSLLTSEQPASPSFKLAAVAHFPIRALTAAAAVGTLVGFAAASLPARGPSAGLFYYQRVTSMADAVPWVYTEIPGGPSDGAAQRTSWAAAGYPICGEGRAQSPIDITTRGNGPQPAIAGVLDNSINSSLPAVALVPSTGRNFQLSAPADAPPIAPGVGTWLRGERYVFAQAHWHTPSENSVDGRNSILEGHFVHRLEGGTVRKVSPCPASIDGAENLACWRAARRRWRCWRSSLSDRETATAS
jgi:hypothetical protein